LILQSLDALTGRNLNCSSGLVIDAIDKHSAWTSRNR